MEEAPTRRECEIEAVGKQRNGKPRYWCSVHQASATAKYGRKLERCEGAYNEDLSASALRLDPHDFAGGIAIWGAVKPVYDSSGMLVEEGVHVHARRSVDDDAKKYDGTYQAVSIAVRRDLLQDVHATIGRDAAVASYVSRFLNRPLTSLFCTYCGTPHLDSDYYAVKMHKRHLCHSCGKIFLANEKGVSNPVEQLRHMFLDTDQNRVRERATRALNRKQSDFPGGVQIWASNPALLWTAPKAEQDGIHFHGYAADGSEIENDTFNSVILDGISLNEEHLRHFMAQNALSYLKGKIASLKCECGCEIFDEGENAFVPRSHRQCSNCGRGLGESKRGKKFVCNPFVNTVHELTDIRHKNREL